jgi:heat shock protein HslJ
MKSTLSLMLIAAIAASSCKSSQPAAAAGKGLTGTYWKLVELNGRAVSAPEGGKEYYLKLDKESGRASAYAGCNQMTGQFTSPDAFRLSFSKMASTMMACPDMSVESEFAKVLETVDSYAIADNHLSLNRARMAPLARFVAAAQPK